MSLGGQTLGAMIDMACATEDYVAIPGSAGVCNQGTGAATTNIYCGSHLNLLAGTLVDAPICDCTAPFTVDVFTNGAADLMTDPAIAGAEPSRGKSFTF